MFYPDSDYFILSALNKKMALDVSMGDKNTAQTILWERHGGFNQRFKIKPVDGKYVIYSFNFLTLQVKNDSNNNGVQVCARYRTNSPN